MDILFSMNERTAVLWLKGRFDFTAHESFADEFKAALEHHSADEIKIDLGNVEYVDSCALGLMLVCRDKAKAARKATSLANAAGRTKTTIDSAHFGKLFAMQ